MGVTVEKETQTTLKGRAVAYANVPLAYVEAKRKHGMTWEGLIKKGIESLEKDDSEDIKNILTNLERYRNRMIEAESRLADLERKA